MTTNRYKEHVLVLPEDDANRQLAVGFLNHPSLDARRIKMLPPLGGWAAVRDALLQHNSKEVTRMRADLKPLLMTLP